ncbi:hypothetical protein AC578_7006 [Pseudocercospora eumusae]|uniref:Stress response protein NST1 n=1 Tax=Pseudocercospora eumusae TaxID=321146 RepID=A0A139HCM0_9PEZI|nr:hypothetical protein AC578_7006 [Pseudocercospora eumusae]
MSTQHTNGLITAPTTGNRKKAKRRAKAAAKSATQLPPPHITDQPPEVGYDEDALRYDEDDDYDSEVEHEYAEQHHYAPPHSNGLYPAPPLPPSKKKNKKKKKSGSIRQGDAYEPHLLPPPRHGHHHSPMRAMSHHGSHHHDSNIWNTSTAQERQNIKEFWLSLSEDERKGLLKIEKEAVLKKMKQQQKHSCSCTVCGRKRTAIEEELEVLYEGYYEELEQYAHVDQPPLPTVDGMLPAPLQHRPPHPLSTPPPPMHPHHRTSHVHEHLDDDEYSEEEDEEEEYSEEDEDEYSDDEPDRQPEPPRGHPGVPDFFDFGSQLTVKGILTPWAEKLEAMGLKGKADNLLTVADDLLKNDGRKFIEMMEQLAERRMARESRSHYEAESHSGYPPNDQYGHEDPLAADDEYDDEEGSYDSQEEYDDMDDEEDEMEGRRMFQIFAARMFEQRVLTAYREKVAAERQAKLLEELADEDKLQAQREAKKQRDAQKKKDKKKQAQQAKAEEKAKRDAEKAAEEARLREAEEKKQEEQRRRKEEQRKKREEEKRKADEEKARKESERLRRQQEEQQRREEAERKAREAKAAEKARKEEQRKKEREEREAREKEARERKAQEEAEKKEREAKAKADKEAKDREKKVHQVPPLTAHPPQLAKRPSQPGMVAVPGVYGKQTASGFSSPHVNIATPAVPKAPTPSKQRQASQQGSHASSPKQSQSQVSSAPSKSSSPGVSGQQTSAQPKQILHKAGNHHPNQQPQPINTPSPLHHQPIQPPPGMPHPHHHPGGFAGMPPMGFNGFPGPQGPMMPGVNRGPMPGMFPNQGPPIGFPNRMSFGHPGMNGMNGMLPPPGMMPPQGRGFPFDGPGMGNPPPGFGQMQPRPPSQTSPIGQPPNDQRGNLPGHSRQQSSDKERFESAVNAPIARPAPIQRPNSVKPPSRNGSNPELEDLSRHLGSSALLDDSDEPVPNAENNRRHSNVPGQSRGINIPGAGMNHIGGFPGGFGAPGSSWNTPAMPFGSSPGLGPPGWSNLPPHSGSWGTNNAAFANNGGFGSIVPPLHRPAGGSMSRPLAIRIAICQACKQLSASSRGEGDKFHNVDVLLRQIEANRPPLDAMPTLQEIEAICETEGDSQNGGGELSIKHNEAEGSYAVKWEADASTPDQSRGHTGLGEIGSPMPSKTSPATGFGAPGMGRAPGPLPNLGTLGSSS